MPSSPVYVFPPFRLHAGERRLLANDLPLKLGGRAFDTLQTLVERHERTVSKSELLDLVWPRLVVEENNLQVQVATLRKLLGHHAIATVPGRGYRFTLPVTIEGAASAAAAADPGPAIEATSETAASPGHLPHRGHDLFGRDGDVAAVLAMLRERRLVTIAGAGGIGKTRLAEAAAAAALAAGEFADGAWWVELASIADPALVPTAVARALGLSLADTGDTLRNVMARVAGRSMLIVLDNCEHLLEGVASFVEAALAAAPRLRLLVTSQEVLRTTDETVFRLGTLSIPTAAGVDAVAASGSGALLLARIAGQLPGFVLTAETAAAAAEICGRLDGIPLAIELAAARVPLLGLEGVRAKLDERFRMLTAGARVVLRRHQTLRAALEWSHGLLGEEERVVFRRLGVFSGGFTLEAAQRVAHDAAIDAWDVLEHLGALVDKSLVLAEGEPIPRYRLLETTRIHALEQLAAAGETATATRRHARAITAQLAALDTPAKRWRSVPEDWAGAEAELDNVRVALDWALRAPGDATLRLELAAASLYTFHFSNLLGEGFERISRFSALACAGPRPPAGEAGVARETDAAGTANRPDGHRDADRPGDAPYASEALASDEASAPAARPTRAARAGYLLAYARIGTQAARAESLDAALAAHALCAELGDDVGRYTALASAVAIAARLDTPLDAEALVGEATALERPDLPPRLRAYFEWARHRWSLRCGLPEQALAHAWRQVELTRESGAARTATLLEASNVAYCELAAGRTDLAEQRARVALAAWPGSDQNAGHALDTWSMALACQGRFDAALQVGRRAHADLDASGDAFMQLDGLAWIAAAQGRLRDAVVTAARADAEFAARRFRRWPLSREWRRRMETLLAEVPTDERARWAREADGLSRETTNGLALGLAP